ncbi:MAG: hypothetical protein IJ300_10200 [Clostridia bacterium]|nr:hypothetical protein [Clostridia bacterium]MBQ8766781.1 hypothetical protein [Clostridia bacterium]
MRKAVSLMLVIATCLLSFASCSGPARVKVNGTKIDNEVYSYFEDLYSGNETEIEKAISRYVTINSEFNNRNLSLSSAQKSELSSDVDNLWHLYGIHYQKLDISKQTIYKIESSKVYEDVLLDYYYGQGGVEPVSEDSIKKYFKANYIAISYATEYLFNIDETGATVPMTDSEKAAIINGFATSEGLVNTGTPIETATDREVHSALINSSYDGSFPSGFYTQVENVKVGSASTIVINNYAFLVQRIDVFDETYGYYDTYRTQCLRELKGDEFDKMVDQWSQSYKVE